ncbi:uncharacterized protein DNG_03840 [Cephalotrichum gorgonifer]|uniref:Uncharacterized protein n=1 Tax=Cephalotrichum gorgonifer TaxID=2041049 RepID=A0AAE8STZ4_9PEZI|nr:uncharacterized protein DNG_03840 [Cephalotrichum gorgonifer]
MPTRTDYVLTLKDSHLDKLTGLLALPRKYFGARPAPSWLDTQEIQTSSLPHRVLRPTRLVRRFAVKVSESLASPVLPPAAVLCPAHKALHPWVIRGLFNLLAAEVTLRCDRLKSFRPRGEEEERRVTVVKDVLGMLHAVNALWLEEEHFEALFGKQVEGPDGKLCRIESGCEACILAAVGARGGLLTCLRANMLARVGRRDPRLLRFVDSWILWFGGDSDRLREEGMSKGKELRKARKAISERRREERRMRRRQSARVRHRAGSVSLHADRGNRKSEEHGSDSRDGSRGAGYTTPRISAYSSLGLTFRQSHDTDTGEKSGDPGTPCLSTANHSGHSEEDPAYEGAACEGDIAEWYASSEVGVDNQAPQRNIHPAFQPGRPSKYDEESPVERDAVSEREGDGPRGRGRERDVRHEHKRDSRNDGFDHSTVLKYYGGGSSGSGDSSGSSSSDRTEAKSWTSVSAHTDQTPTPASHVVSIPGVRTGGVDAGVGAAGDNNGDDGRKGAMSVSISASSSVYPSSDDVEHGAPPPSLAPGRPLSLDAGPNTREDHEWKDISRLEAVSFRDPFAEDRSGEDEGRGRRRRRSTAMVSPTRRVSGVEGRWI